MQYGKRRLSDRGGEISGQDGCFAGRGGGRHKRGSGGYAGRGNGISGIFFVRKASVSGSRNVG